jgi:hypothetical protein
MLEWPDTKSNKASPSLQVDGAEAQPLPAACCPSSPMCHFQWEGMMALGKRGGGEGKGRAAWELADHG